jgi:hypothetical protein
MGRRHTPAPEGYYEDEEEAPLDVGVEAGRSRLRQRLAAVLSTSYGLSLMIHVAVLLVLATIILSGPPAERVAVLQMGPPVPPPPPYDPERRKDMHRQEKLEAVEPPTPDPVVDQEVELPVVEMPKGVDTAISQKQVTPDALNRVDAAGIGGGPAGRWGHERGSVGVGKKNGQQPESEEAVRGALEWLARHQEPSGRWACGGWQGECKKGRCSGPGTDAGSVHHDVGVSALAVLAFLGNGHTPAYSPVSHFRVAVRKGLAWVRKQQRADGSVGFDLSRSGHTIYDHAIATMALCEAYAVTRDPMLRRPCELAVAFSLGAQNPGLGWRYGIRPGQNDTSVTGWFVLALKAAKVAAIEVDPAAFEGARAWFDRATDARGDAGYQTPGGGSSFLGPNEGKFDPLPVNTAVATLSRLFMGERRGADVVRDGVKLLAAAPPEAAPRKLNYYYWYYATYAMFQHGGDAWDRWSGPMQAALLAGQRSDGCADGSWDGVDEWSLVGGRVYATAINALTLEVFYRFERMQERSRLEPEPRQPR